jgi:cbb3-type cytochrome oxidase subunit 1
MKTLQIVWPWRMVRSISGTAMLLGHAIFAVHFVMLLLKVGGRRETAPYFSTPNLPKQELASV